MLLMSQTSFSFFHKNIILHKITETVSQKQLQNHEHLKLYILFQKAQNTKQTSYRQAS